MGKMTIKEVISYSYNYIEKQTDEKEIEFYKQAYEEIKSCIKIEIVNIDKITNLELPKTPIFPENHIIQLRDLVIVCSETNDNEGYCISIYTKLFDKVNIDSIIIDKEKYPRIYIACKHQKICKHANTLKYVETMPFCMKTKRVMHNCMEIEKDAKLLQAIKATYGKNIEKIKIFKTFAEKIMYVIDLLNKLGYYIQTEKRVGSRIYKKQNNKSNIKKAEGEKNTYFSPIRYIDSEPTRIARTSAPKCKHTRRSHYRRVGDRLVKVKSCIIHPEKEDTIYKI